VQEGLQALLIENHALPDEGFPGLAYHEDGYVEHTPEIVTLSDSSKINLKAVDEVYICNFCALIPSQTMSKQEDKYTCDNNLIKSKVVKIDNDMPCINPASFESPMILIIE
jgi:hypothetical protein